MNAGNRLEKPQGCPEDIYAKTMAACWAKDASMRPTFAELKIVAKVVFDAHGYVFSDKKEGR